MTMHTTIKSVLSVMLTAKQTVDGGQTDAGTSQKNKHYSFIENI